VKVEIFELQKFHLVFIEHSYVVAFIPHNIFTLKLTLLASESIEYRLC